MSFDPLGLSQYDPETETLIPDQHLNIYEMGQADEEDPEAGKIMNHGDMEALLGTAKDGYVTLPDGRKVKEDSFRNHVEGNAEILSDSAKYKDTRSAHSALENGHMSYSEAQTIEGEITNKKGAGGDGVKSWGEHWNAREALNRPADIKRIADSPFGKQMSRYFVFRVTIDGVDWNRAEADQYHGPDKDFRLGKAKNVNKFVTKGGREIVMRDDGTLETRSLYGGTYNFGKKQVSFGHVKYDIDPWKDRGKRNNPYE